MKRHLILLLLAILIWSCSDLQAQTIYPIPSYNVFVIKTANFQESRLTTGTNNVKNRRGVIIRPGFCTTDSLSCTCTVYVYSLDGQTKLGPFTVNCGESLYVEIDDRLWGVLIITDDPTCVDVFISEGEFVQPGMSISSFEQNSCRD